MLSLECLCFLWLILPTWSLTDQTVQVTLCGQVVVLHCASLLLFFTHTLALSHQSGRFKSYIIGGLPGAPRLSKHHFAAERETVHEGRWNVYACTCSLDEGKPVQCCLCLQLSISMDVLSYSTAWCSELGSLTSLHAEFKLALRRNQNRAEALSRVLIKQIAAWICCIARRDRRLDC